MKTSTAPLPDRLAVGVAALLSANIGGMVLKGLTILVLASYLFGPEQYGLLFFALAVVTFTQRFADLGIARSAARYVSEYQVESGGQVPHIIRTALAVNLLTILVVSGVLVGFSGWIAELAGEPRIAPLVALGAVYVPVRSLRVFASTLFQGLNHVTYSALLTGIVRVSEFVLVIGLAALTGTVFGAYVGFVISATLGAAVGGYLLYTRFYTRFETAPEMEPGLARRIVEYNVPLTTTKGAGALLSKTDILLLGFFWNPVVVGIYTLGLQIAEFVTTPASSLGFAISPTFGEHKAKDDLEGAARIYEESLRHVLLLYVPAAVGLFIVAGPAVELVFGSDYANTVPVLQLLTAFIVLSGVNAITNTSLDYLGRATLRAYAKVGGAGLNVVLNLALVPSFGAVGAAVATVVTFAILVTLNVFLLFRELPVSLDRIARVCVQVTAIALLMGLLVLPAASYVSGVASLAGVVVLGVLVWSVLAVASGLLEPQRVAAVVGRQ